MIILSTNPSKIYNPDFDDFILYDNKSNKIDLIDINTDVVWTYIDIRNIPNLPPELINYMCKIPRHAVKIAHKLNKRLPDHEKYIIRNPLAAYLYAANVLNTRWLEAEPYIHTDEFMWYLYVDRFKIEFMNAIS